MKDFISYELAKKLENKGFDCDNNYGYNDKGDICVPVYNIDEDQLMTMTPCPEIHEVLKWLREEKHTYIYMDVCKEGWLFEVKCLRTFYMINTDFFDKYESYEKAAIAGIEYVVNNLI
jgi:hypothetical protein